MECCGKVIKKKGVMKSGNSNYQLYECDSCGSEKMECIGLL